MSFPDFTGAGTPEGAQVGAIGQVYEDTDTGNLYTKVADDGLNTGWQGPFVMADRNDVASSDNPTTVPADGTDHQVDCDMAAPPAWLNTTSEIIVAGLYSWGATVDAGVAPTTPGVVGTAKTADSPGMFWVDALGLDGGFGIAQTIAVGAADLPFPVTVSVAMQTDVTATVSAAVTVQRLGFYVP